MKRYFLIIAGFWSAFLFPQKQLTERQIDSTLNALNTSAVRNISYIEPGLIELYYKSGEISYIKGQMESLLRLTAFYLNKRKNAEKIKANLDEAEKLALKKGDYFYYCKAKALRSGYLSNMALYEQSAAMLRSGSGFFNRISDKSRRNYIKAYYYARYVNLYSLQDRKDSVLFYGRKMYEASLQLSENDPQKSSFIAVAARVLTDIYSRRKEPTEAEYYLRIQEKYVKKLNDPFDIAMFHKTKAEFISRFRSYEKNYADSALYHFKRAEKYIIATKDPVIQSVFYSEITEVYKKRNDHKSQALYQEHFAKLKDSLDHDGIRKSAKININSLIPEFDQEMINSEEDIPDRTFVIWHLLWIPALFLFLFLLLWLYRHSVLQRIIKLKAEKNGSVPVQDKNKIAELTCQALNNDKAFFINFMKEFPDFGDKLLDINPNIKASDIEFCALLRLNLEAKQIAEIKKMSLPAVTAKRSRLRKKLNIHSDENLYIWILRL